jgi:hypothetical protein
MELLKLKGRPLNGLAITLGKCSTDAVGRFMEKVPTLLKGGRVPIDLLTSLLESSESAARRDKFVATRKKAGKTAISVGSAIVTVISTVQKYAGHLHF